ncbi:hypothetical protein MTO96_024137 [Rhipicephalus appendiculatus]
MRLPRRVTLGSLEEEANLLPSSSSTSPQPRRLYEQTPRHGCRDSRLSTDDNAACEGGDGPSNLRHSEMPQFEKADCAHAQTDGFDAGPLSPPIDADSGSEFCVSPTDENNGGNAGANAAGTFNRGSCTTFSDAHLRSYRNLASMTLKPHVNMYLKDPQSPTFYLSVSGQATMQHVSAYLSKRLSPDGAWRNDQRSPMYSLYAASMMGDLIPLPDTMMLNDVVRNVKRPGELLEMYYAKSEN